MYGPQRGTLLPLQKEETCIQRKQSLKKKKLGIAGHLIQLMLYVWPNFACKLMQQVDLRKECYVGRSAATTKIDLTCIDS